MDAVRNHPACTQFPCFALRGRLCCLQMYVVFSRAHWRLLLCARASVASPCRYRSAPQAAALRALSASAHSPNIENVHAHDARASVAPRVRRASRAMHSRSLTLSRVALAARQASQTGFHATQTAARVQSRRRKYATLMHTHRPTDSAASARAPRQRTRVACSRAHRHAHNRERVGRCAVPNAIFSQSWSAVGIGRNLCPVRSSTHHT